MSYVLQRLLCRSCSRLSASRRRRPPVSPQRRRLARPVPPRPWTVPRTADGQPDLQGIWDFSHRPPLQRPAALGDKAFYTEQEAAAFEKRKNRRQNRGPDRSKVGGLKLPAGRRRPLQRGLVRPRRTRW